MKLELKHLAPYLPYNLQCLLDQSDFPKSLYMKTFNLRIIEPLVGIKNSKFLTGGNRVDVDDWNFKPILRPVSNFGDSDDTRKVHEFIGLRKWCEAYDVYFEAWFNDLSNTDKLVLQAPYEIFNYFLSNHYDVFGLIKKCLAVSVHDVEQADA